MLHDVVEHQLAEVKESKDEAKLSLNTIMGASKLSIMRLKARIGKHEVFLLVDFR